MIYNVAVCLAILSSVLFWELTAAQEFNPERLKWHHSVKENAANITLTCYNGFYYPFNTLNTTDNIGNSVTQPVKSIEWVLPSGRVIGPSDSDSDWYFQDQGIKFIVKIAKSSTFGLYHCKVLALANASNPSEGLVTKYIKRGINVYGVDIYDTLWEKYSRNTLIGSVSTAIFLGLVTAVVLFQKFKSSKKQVEPLKASSDVNLMEDNSKPAGYGTLPSTATTDADDVVKTKSEDLVDETVSDKDNQSLSHMPTTATELSIDEAKVESEL